MAYTEIITINNRTLCDSLSRQKINTLESQMNQMGDSVNADAVNTLIQDYLRRNPFTVPSEYITESELEAKKYLTQHQDLSHKQDKLVSGTNIKTINGQTILGSGNITIQGSTTSGADGKDGVGIQSVIQTTTSSSDGGNNIITVTLTNGTTSTFYVKNGSKGSTGAKGEDGSTPVRGVDYWTENDKNEIKSYVNDAILNGAW